MFYKLGEFAHRYRWQIIGVWIFLFLASGIFAPRASTVFKGGFGSAETESRVALNTLEQNLGWNSSVITIVFSNDALKASDQEFRKEVEATLVSLQSTPQVERIVSPYNPQGIRMISEDNHTAFAQVYLADDLSGAQDLVEPIRKKLKTTKLEAKVTGGIAIFADINSFVEKDLQRAEVITLPLVFIALLLVFGTLVAAGIPVITGIVSVTITLAFLYLVAQMIDVSIFALNITSFLGLGVAIDYSLFIVSRFREEAQRLGWGKEAIAKTIATAGVAIAFSAVTTILGLSGLLLFKFMMLRSIGLGGITVILISLLMALTLMPAILSVLGQRINSLAFLPQWRVRSGFWTALASAVMSRPLLVLFPILLFLLVLGYPFLKVKVGAPWEQTLPHASEARQGWQRLQTAFGAGELSPVLIAVTSPTGVFQASNLDALYDFTHKLAEDKRVARVDSIVTIDRRIAKEQYRTIYARPDLLPPQAKTLLDQLARDNTTLVRVITTLSVNSNEAEQLVRDIRLSAPGSDLKVQVTGATADLMDAVALLYHDFPRAIIFIIFTTYIALLVLFRSLLLPLKAILMNTLSISASYGALVFIFQQGHFQEVLRFSTEGYTEATAPILLFCILFGLSMDYEVFLLSRIKEFYQESSDNTNSVAHGLERSGGIITSAALILVLVATGFSTGEVIVMKEIGFGTALAIFIDATIVRALLVPSLMRIMGDLNWWAPRFVKAVIPEIGRLR